MGHDTPSNPDDPSPFAGDALLESISAANPVSSEETSTASWDGADSLFAQITSRPGGFEPFSQASQSHGDAGKRSRWPMLASVAGALALLASAVVVFAPGSSQPALAAVSSAANQTAEAQSGRVITTFSAVGEEADSAENLSGTLTALFNEDDVAVTIDVGPSSSVAGADDLAEINQAETRLIDGQLFITSDGEEWFSVDAPEFIQSALVELTDLRTVLAQVNELVAVDEIGPTALDGLSVTHFRSEVDLADESLAESGWLPGVEGAQAAAVDIDAEGLVTIDMYVDSDGLMRRIEVSGDAVPADPAIDASVNFTVKTDFVDLGSDISIEGPSADSVQSLLDEFDIDD